METSKVLVTYDSVGGQWSAKNPVVVYPGLTRIEWTIALTKESTGAITFGTEPEFPGILFDSDWPGTKPLGDEKTWSVEINDTLKPGDPSVEYHYTVNSWYKSADRETPPVKKSWDPDVEEDPDDPPPL